MALVVLLRGVNVGGHKTFRPSLLAQQLRHLDVVNIGAAGTFIVRKPVGQTKARTEFVQRLPFETEVIICHGKDVLQLISSDPFSGRPADGDTVPFVSVLAKRRSPSAELPQYFPATGDWGMTVLGQQGQLVFGLYRRQMKAISYLSQVDRLFGVPATTRNWNTIISIGKLLLGAPSSTKHNKLR